ncbi:hypothetical protein [Enterobacter cloacae]|uniref:hypothetical protein n=1 Tax=Enterobacter cloacae TaxID=550 RepID=UPI00390624F6
MSISETNKAQRYAAIAEVAAAQAKIYADKIILAPDYAEQAEAAAIIAQDAANTAQDAIGTVNDLAASASESASSAAASAAEAGNAAGAAIGRTVRVPEGEFLNELPSASSRQNVVSIFGNDSNPTVKPLNEFAILDDNGKIPASMIPAIALNEPFVVSSQAEMLDLDAQVGDIAKRTDLGYSFCLASEPASTLSNWVQLTDDVLSILADKSGAAAIGAEDSEGVATTVQTLLDGKVGLSTLSSPSGLSSVGIGPQGNLTDIINWVTPEQWENLVGPGNDWTAAIQAAIDYVAGIGGGVVELSAKVYRAAGIVLKPMVCIKGQGVTLTTIKAPDNWSAVAVIYSVDFTDYVDQDKNTLPIHGAYGAAIHDLYIDGNYDNFSGTPARLYGHGLALGGTIHLDEVEVMYCPSSCLMKFNYQGSPNQQPPWWPANKGLHAVNQHGNVVCKWAGYDTVIIYEPDGVYTNLIAGMSARGMVSSDMTTRSLWDTSRICVVSEFPSGITVLKGHFYAGLVGAIFRGTATRWDYIVMETVSVGFWTTATSQVQGGVSDIHNCDSSRQLTGIPAIGSACPAFIIQSGGTGTNNSELASDYGTINVLNYTVSSTQPSIYFCGAHGWVNGKHNLVNVNIQRSRFLATENQNGGIGLILQGKQCTVTGQIVGFWKTDYSGNTSCAVQVQPGASFKVDLTIARCALGFRWTSSSDRPRIVGSLNFSENISTYTEAYGTNATLQQLGILSMSVPSGGNRCKYTSASNVDVTTTATQTINVSTAIADTIGGTQGLPYIPRLGEVTAEVVNTNQPQAQYPGVISVQYEPASSTLTNLVFKVRMKADSGDSAGAVLLAKIG